MSRLNSSWPEIAKFQNKPFPLYDKLGDLYDGHIAEGNFNFTSTEVTEVSDGDLEVEREKTAFSFDLNQYGDDLHMYDDPRDAAPSDGPSMLPQVMVQVMLPQVMVQEMLPQVMVQEMLHKEVVLLLQITSM